MPSDSDQVRRRDKLSLAQFYKAIWSRAIGGKLDYAKRWQTLASLALGLGGTIVSPFIAGGWPVVSSALTAFGWVPFLAFFGGFLWALIRDLTQAPHQIYLEQAEKADAAEAVIRDLRRTPDPACEFVNPGDMGSGRLEKMAPATVHRIALKNLSPSAQLTGVEVTLLRYTDLQTGKVVPIRKQLHDLRGNLVVAIAPRDVRHFNVVAVRPEKTPPRLYFVPPPEGISPHRADAGQYELEVQVATAAAPPVPARFLLEVDRSGKVKLKMIT